MLRPDTIRVNIPPGAEPGKQIRLRGKGEAGVRGGPPGDLYITPRIRPHPLLTRSGRDLTMELPITIGEAVRGASVEVPTPAGTISVKVPAGAQSGQQLRIKGKGVCAHGQTPAGDLYFRLMVRVPKDKMSRTKSSTKSIGPTATTCAKTSNFSRNKKMARKYLRITEVTRICGVDSKFVTRLERENVIAPIVRRSQKLYPLDQVDRVRVARLLIEEMGVNLEGAEVALNMREQMIAMQRQFNEILRLLRRELKK